MKTAWQIEFDFSQARQQAGQLEEIAQRLEALAQNQLQSAQEELPSYWTGRSASLFQNKQEQLRQNVLTTARAIRAEAEDIRTVARRLYEAEQAALEIAQRPEYGGSGRGGGGGGGGHGGR